MSDQNDAPTTADGKVVDEVDGNFVTETLKSRLNDMVAAIKVPTNEAEAKRLPVVVDAVRDISNVLDQINWRENPPMGPNEPSFTFTAEQLLQEFVSDKQLAREVKRRKAERTKAD